MVIVDTRTGEQHIVEIKPVESKDYKSITKSRYFFDWRLEKEQEVYKLVIAESTDI